MKPPVPQPSLDQMVATKLAQELARRGGRSYRDRITPITGAMLRERAANRAADRRLWLQTVALLTIAFWCLVVVTWIAC